MANGYEKQETAKELFTACHTKRQITALTFFATNK